MEKLCRFIICFVLCACSLSFYGVANACWYHQTYGMTDSATFGLPQPNDGTWAESTNESMCVVYQAPQPDKVSFITAMNTSLGGIIVANNYAKAYPLFMSAFDANDWVNASLIIQDALTTAVITSAQYAAIKAASLTYNIPLNLP